MDKVKVPERLEYMASADEPFDLNVSVELADHRFNEETEELIDKLMEEFYKKFNKENIKLKVK